MNYASFIPYVTLTTFTPGPNNLMAMTNAGRTGFRKAFPFCLGVCAGFFLVQLCSALFGVLLFGLLPKIQGVMRYIGAAYILYLAFTILRNRPRDEKKRRFEPDGFLTGVLFQFINPKGILYGITVMSTYVLPAYSSPAIIVLFALAMALVSLASTVCWALMGTAIQHTLKRYSLAFNIIMALLLVYCAVTLLIH